MHVVYPNHNKITLINIEPLAFYTGGLHISPKGVIL